MGIEILMFGNIQIKKKNYRHITPTFLVDVDLSFGEKNISTLLVACTIVIKSSH